MNSTDHFHQVFDCIEKAHTEGALSDFLPDDLSGWSGGATIGTLQRLANLFCDDGNAAYVEVGVFQGQSLISVALKAPQLPCYGIDNFSQFDPDGVNLEIVNKRLERYGGTNVHVLNMGFEEAFAGMSQHLNGRKIAIYLIDGAHDYRSQMMGLLLAMPHLHERAVILVDDANYSFVRQSTEDFLLTHPDFKMAFEAYSPDHPANMDADTHSRWRNKWITGTHVLVRDPENFLNNMVPPTESSRELFVNDWLIHRIALAELGPEALRLGQAICFEEPEDELRAELLRQYNNRKAEFAGRRPDRNTYSASLTLGRFNEFR